MTGDVYTLTGVGSGKCLEVPGSSTAQSVQLAIYTCNGGANQQWSFDPTGSYTSSSNASYVLVNLTSGWVVDVTGSSTTAGAAVKQYAANGGTNQTWTVG